MTDDGRESDSLDGQVDHVDGDEQVDHVDGDEQVDPDEQVDHVGHDRGSVDDRAPIAGLGGRDGPWTPSSLAAIRARPRRRTAAIVAAVLVGLAAAWVHWLGLFVAGALVGLASRTVPRALLTAVAVGVIVLVLQVLASPVMDAGEFLALTPPAYVAVAAAVLLPAWGSLVRGVV